MLSDPSDSSSSDTRSFDVEDMFGSDSEIETISLPSGLPQEVEVAEGCMVCTYRDLTDNYLSYLSGPLVAER